MGTFVDKTLAFHIELRPGSGRAYDHLHEKLPDSALKQLQDAGVESYRIFRDEDHIFGVLQILSLERFQQVMSADPDDAGWTDSAKRFGPYSFA